MKGYASIQAYPVAAPTLPEEVKNVVLAKASVGNGGEEGSDHVERGVGDIQSCHGSASMEHPGVRIHVVSTSFTLPKNLAELWFGNPDAEMVSELEEEI